MIATPDLQTPTIQEQSSSGDAKPRLETPYTSPRSRPGSPLYIEFINLSTLDSKLEPHLQRPPTPILSPISNPTDDIDKIRGQLVSWGLTAAEVDCARRWDQKPLHHSAEVIHMKLLSECAESLTGSPPSLHALYHEYDRKMRLYNRRQDTRGDFDTVQGRAQRSINMLVSDMAKRGCSSEEIARYQTAISTRHNTMELITELCEIKLGELRQRGKKHIEQKPLRANRPRRPRRSARIAKRTLRASKYAG